MYTCVDDERWCKRCKAYYIQMVGAGHLCPYDPAVSDLNWDYEADVVWGRLKERRKGLT